MRLHRLQVTAFGPFSGTEEIDFGALSDAGLFLIHGQTGAGKTSVLDAICFALYGKVPGARRAAASARGALRSDHAAAGLAPRVVLEATIRGRRFRITRSPAWDRPKRRGDGVTAEKESVIVEEFTGGAWTGHTTRLDEAGDLLTGLLGMNVDQFCQVVMLPQGAFAAFLRAGAEDRRQVLEKLFAAEVYAQVEKWLEAHRADTRREAEALRTEAERTADKIMEVVRAARPDGDFVAWSTGWAAEAAAQQEAVRSAAGQLKAEAAAALEQARQTVERGRVQADRQRRHAEAVRRAEALAASAQERAELATRLELAARADRVVPLIRAVTDRVGRWEQAVREAAEARAKAADLVPAQAPEDVLVKAERDRLDQVAALEQLTGEAVRRGELSAQLAEVAQRLTRLEVQQAELTSALTELPGRVEALRAELESVRITAATRDGAVTAVEEAGLRLEAARRRDVLTGALAQAQTAHRAAVDVAQEARERLLELRQTRLEGMAAVLAGELVPGEACRVCGSSDHPAPAVALGVVPTEADEQRAQDAYERAQRDREDAAARAAERRAELEAVRDRVGDRPAQTLALESAAAEAELTDIDAVAARAPGLAADLQRAEAELATARDRHEAVVQARAGQQAGLDEATAEVERLTALLDQARGEDPSLQARIDRLTAEAALVRAASEAAGRAGTARDELAAARAAAAHAAADDGFASLDDVLQAMLPDAGRSQLRERARLLDGEETAVSRLLADPELAAAAASPAPELSAAQAALAAVEELHTEVSGRYNQAVTRCDRLAELRAVLAGQVGAWRPAAERHATAARLASIAAGDPACNTERMRLSAYVLAARLIQVVRAANDRLGRMSGGRYALRHTVDRTAGEGGRRHGTGGLGLRVIDAWTGQERDPATLSGGESFVSSLALALGLADVVTAEAGGTEIGTLFVDEGFGTLDEETLDEVMDVLDGLRDGGRAVGIVSHVAELRSRIPARLRVVKDRTGSRVAITT